MIANKKAVSGVIVVVLMVLLVIAAVAIVWVVIRNLASEIQVAEGAADCLALDLEITGASFDSGTNTLTVDVQRVAGEGDVKELRFIVDGTALTIGDDDNVQIPDIGETKTSVIVDSGLSAPQKVEVAAVIEAEPVDKTCSVADTEDIS